MTKFNVKYLEISIKTVEIEADTPSDAQSEFKLSYPASSTSLIHPLDVKPVRASGIIDELPKVIDHPKPHPAIIADNGMVESIDNLILERLTKSLRVYNKTCRLSDKEYAVMSTLFDNKNQVVTYDKLVSKICEMPIPATRMSDRKALSTCISRIRHKLSQVETNAVIENVPQMGYKLTC